METQLTIPSFTIDFKRDILPYVKFPVLIPVIEAVWEGHAKHIMDYQGPDFYEQYLKDNIAWRRRILTAIKEAMQKQRGICHAKNMFVVGQSCEAIEQWHLIKSRIRYAQHEPSFRIYENNLRTLEMLMDGYHTLADVRKDLEGTCKYHEFWIKQQENRK